MTLKALVVGFILTFVFLTPANAYLDPGTGSVLIQSIFAAIAGVIVFFGHLRRSVLTLLAKVLRKKKI